MNFDRKAFLAFLFGILLGFGFVPALDFNAEHQSFGKDTKAPLPESICFAIGMQAGPEIYLAKRMGVTKRGYMNYILKASKDMEDVRGREQIVWYISEMWSAKDDGSAVIQQCFDAAPKSKQPEAQVN